MPDIYVALPAMDEAETLPVFIDCFRRQTYPHKKLVVCVNQPDAWWNKVEMMALCLRNQQALEYLHSIEDLSIEIIDHSSKGRGWAGKKTGVGWARKVVMDRIAGQASPLDVIISLDADTTFNPGYFQSVIDTLNSNQKAVAISMPYYHNLTGEENKDRAILHYEIYMRYYAINLWRIENPYAFTAIGSAMALPVKAYHAIGGITPHHSGEDFYFLQKLRKYGEVLTWNPEKVYPAARYSDRVGFGTGPAMIKGSQGEWGSYPIYPYALFDEVKITTDLFLKLFLQDQETPMDTFNSEKFGDKSIWQALRENFKTVERFVKACHHKIDALRILQFLKWKHNLNPTSDEENFIEFMHHFYPEKWRTLDIHTGSFSLEKSPVKTLDKIRDLLAEIEADYQKSNAIKKS